MCFYVFTSVKCHVAAVGFCFVFCKTCHELSINAFVGFYAAGKNVYRGFANVKWSNIFTFPIKVCFSAIAIGLVPPVKNLIVGKHAPFAIVKESLDCMGGAMIPCMMMVLGANLSKVSFPPP
jgi:predicted permease